jgi:O-antigen/teichoic acid export membrane protein
LTVQVLLSVALVSILVLGVWLADHVLHRWSVGTMVWPMAAAMVAYQLQEWARRCFFAQRTAKPVLGSDLLAYGGQLLLILGLGWAGRLTMTSAFLSMAVCYGLGFAVSMAQLRVKPSMTAARWVASSMWRTSRDYLLSGQFQWIGASGVLFVGAGALGVQSAAAIRTVQNLLGPTNILFQALENLAPVQCSHRFKSGGVAALSSYLRKLMLVFGGPLAVFLLGIALMGTELLTAAYGQAYSAFGHLVALQCGYVFLSFAVRLLMFRRRALDQVQVISLASLLSAIVSVASVAVLARPFQDVGVLGGMLGGLAASLLVLWRWPASRRATAAN